MIDLPTTTSALRNIFHVKNKNKNKNSINQNKLSQTKLILEKESNARSYILGIKTDEFKENFSRMSRGLTRSGRAYIRQNLSYYNSIQELKTHHSRLFNEPLAVASRFVRLTNRAVLQQTSARTIFNSRQNTELVQSAFEDLFSQINQSVDFHGFECVITFNAILTNKDFSTYSVFYGVDFRDHNEAGSAPELRYPCKYF